MVKNKKEEEEKQGDGGEETKKRRRARREKMTGGFLFLLDTEFQILTLLLMSLPGIRKLSGSWSSAGDL